MARLNHARIATQSKVYAVNPNVRLINDVVDTGKQGKRQTRASVRKVRTLKIHEYILDGRIRAAQGRYQSKRFIGLWSGKFHSPDGQILVKPAKEHKPMMNCLDYEFINRVAKRMKKRTPHSIIKIS